MCVCVCVGGGGWVRGKFTFLLMNNSRLLQKVIVNMASSRIAFEVEINVHVFAETTRVVVAFCFGISKRFHNLVGPDQHVCDPVCVGGMLLVCVEGPCVCVWGGGGEEHQPTSQCWLSLRH